MLLLSGIYNSIANKNYFYLVIVLVIATFLFSCSSTIESTKGTKSIIRGYASYYADKFHGKATASGDIYNMNELTAAHKELPFSTRVRVKNLKNGLSVIVRINDRGPFVDGRIIDLSKAAAQAINMIKDGVVEVEITILD